MYLFLPDAPEPDVYHLITRGNLQATITVAWDHVLVTSKHVVAVQDLHSTKPVFCFQGRFKPPEEALVFLGTEPAFYIDKEIHAAPGGNLIHLPRMNHT